MLFLLLPEVPSQTGTPLDGWTDGRTRIVALAGDDAQPRLASRGGTSCRSPSRLSDWPRGMPLMRIPWGLSRRGEQLPPRATRQWDESRVRWPCCLEAPPSSDERAMAPEAGSLGWPLSSLGDGVTASCSHDFPEGSSPRHSWSLRNNKLESSRSLVQRVPGRARPGRAKETLPAPPGCLQWVPALCRLES